jgi:lipopolysaccharide/colanic/teichoic acid biosynthesis glycosyltransferase
VVRAFDLFWSIAGLAVLSPLFLLVGALVKLADGGPVFYRQERIGRGGVPFRILKFRTMRTDADRVGTLITVGRDPRITPVGAFLRRWKIDELPQLVNVVRGEMGLVGPRPEVPRYVALYTPDQARVLRLRPGVTDVASIAYRYENDLLQGCPDPEAFYVQRILPDKIRINLEYAARASVWSNFKVILATLGLLSPPIAPVRPSEHSASGRMD